MYSSLSFGQCIHSSWPMYTFMYTPQTRARTFVWPVLAFHPNGILGYVPFCLCLILLSILVRRSSHDFVLCPLLFFFFFLFLHNRISLYKNITVCWIHSPADGHSHCFQFGAIMNRALVNIFAELWFFPWAHSRFSWVNKGVWDLLGHVVNLSLCNFIRNC